MPPPTSDSLALLIDALGDFRSSWKELALTSLVFKLIVLHDSDFMKLAGNKLKIWHATMDDLKNIDIGSRFASEFKDERVPTLGEVLDEC